MGPGFPTARYDKKLSSKENENLLTVFGVFGAKAGGLEGVIQMQTQEKHSFDRRARLRCASARQPSPQAKGGASEWNRTTDLGLMSPTL